MSTPTAANGHYEPPSVTRNETGLDVPLDPASPGEWVVDHHYDNLVKQIKTKHTGRRTTTWENGETGDTERDAGVTEPEHSYRISFAEMQRMHLRKLQIKLINHAVHMRKTRKESAKWENDLAKYIQGMKDYDYMRECAERTQDFFMATGERYVDRVVMSVMIDDRAQLHGLGKQDHIEPWQEDDPIPIGDTRRKASSRLWWKGFQERCQLAAIGGAFLLGPMWLMVLHRTLYTGLITTTVCVVIFGFLGSWWLEKPMDVLSATAAYAAVLVVFVGLTTS